MIGSRVNVVQGSDPDGDDLIYSIGSPSFMPSQLGSLFGDGAKYFRIDPSTGVVYLAASLDGTRGQRLMVGAGVFDGQVSAKMDIMVTIMPSDLQVLANPVVTSPPRPITNTTQVQLRKFFLFGKPSMGCVTSVS